MSAERSPSSSCWTIIGVDEAEVGDAGAGAVRRELDPERAAELLDPGLRHRVRSLAGPVHEGVHRGGDDDVASTGSAISGRAASAVL